MYQLLVPDAEPENQVQYLWVTILDFFLGSSSTADSPFGAEQCPLRAPVSVVKAPCWDEQHLCGQFPAYGFNSMWFYS